jgi:hypothetical protein
VIHSGRHLNTDPVLAVLLIDGVTGTSRPTRVTVLKVYLPGQIGWDQLLCYPSLFHGQLINPRIINGSSKIARKRPRRYQLQRAGRVNHKFHHHFMLQRFKDNKWSFTGARSRRYQTDNRSFYLMIVDVGILGIGTTTSTTMMLMERQRRR